jgi:hypothetical protein
MYKGFKGCNFVYGGGPKKFLHFFFSKISTRKKVIHFNFYVKGDGSINFLEFFFSKLIRRGGGGYLCKGFIR